MPDSAEPCYAREEWAREAPVVLHARARRLPAWQKHPDLYNAGDPPVSPARADTPEENVDLVPYGCTRLRIAEFPVILR